MRSTIDLGAGQIAPFTAISGAIRLRVVPVHLRNIHFAGETDSTSFGLPDAVFTAHFQLLHCAILEKGAVEPITFCTKRHELTGRCRSIDWAAGCSIRSIFSSIALCNT